MRTFQENEKARIGITHGDINGIGYEVIIKALSDQRMLDFCTPIIYGNSKVASYHKKMLNSVDVNLNLIKKADMAIPKRVHIINVVENEVKIEIGKPTSIAGELAYLALEKAVEDYKSGLIDAIVTGPIQKSTIQSNHFNFPGHTEYFGNRFDTQDHLMFMVGPSVRIGVATGHIPLSEVVNQLSIERLIKKISIMNHSLKKDFGIPSPKIALLGLNPHAGDDGLLGKKEKEVLIPSIQQAQTNGINAFGPYPADGFFGSGAFKQFDGILAMYHDQGLIPFKLLSFDEGVNFTAGLPVIRTSPGHGTGYDIAGKGSASCNSFRKAIFLAIEILNNRRNFEENIKSPLHTNSTR